MNLLADIPSQVLEGFSLPTRLNQFPDMLSSIFPSGQPTGLLKAVISG